ncbi:hypothetical protein BaRGS_00039288, partial [Batillaria attramentaria]
MVHLIYNRFNQVIWANRGKKKHAQEKHVVRRVNRGGVSTGAARSNAFSLSRSNE